MNTEIMQRDNSSPSSPISSDNAPQDLHEERNAEERSGEEQKATTMKSMGKRERRMGMDLGGRREREGAGGGTRKQCTPRRRWCILLIIMIIPRSRL